MGEAMIRRDDERHFFCSLDCRMCLVLWVHVWTDGLERQDHCIGRGANLYRAPICTVRRSLPQMRACQKCTTQYNHGVFFVDVSFYIFFAVSLSSCPGFCLCS